MYRSNKKKTCTDSRVLKAQRLNPSSTLSTPVACAQLGERANLSPTEDTCTTAFVLSLYCLAGKGEETMSARKKEDRLRLQICHKSVAHAG
jgi:hypothetical protein